MPAGAVITSAVLQVNCTNPGNAMQLYRLTQDWVEDEATWNQRATGVPWGSAGADGAASNAGVALTGDCTATGLRLFDVTRFVQEWSNGAPNYGVVLTDSGTDGVDFASSESGTSPVLTVVYRASQQPLDTQPLAGVTADVSFSRRSAARPDLLLECPGHRHHRPAELGACRLRADARRERSRRTGARVAGRWRPATSATSPTLSATVSDPGGGPLNVSVALRRAAAPEFTIIALPDTQHYSESFPAIFTSQTQWIVDNKEARNIVFVTHEGDIVESEHG